MRHNKDETWCRSNITNEEHKVFWNNWCETQWGMPTFSVKREWVENFRKTQYA